jgi:hypothetical protein
MGSLEDRAKHMLTFSRRAIATLVGAIATGGLGLGAATAADIPLRPGPQYGQSQEYYGEPPAEEAYAYQPPPVAYYPPPPPPVAYYGYAPPPVVVVPEIYPRRRYVYAGPVYGRGYAPYFARGYGRYGGEWRRGHGRW